MSELQLVLIILGSLLAFFQVTLAGLGIAAAVSGKSVRVGFSSGILASLLFIAAVLV